MIGQMETIADIIYIRDIYHLLYRLMHANIEEFRWHCSTSHKDVYVR